MVFARAFSVVLTAVLTAVTQHGASAQSAYPTRPVTIVVPAAAKIAAERRGASSRLIKTADRISERPPRGGLSFSRRMSAIGT